MVDGRRYRLPILAFLAPAVLVYTVVLVLPLFNTMRLALYAEVDQVRTYVGLDNFRALVAGKYWGTAFWNALANNTWWFVVHLAVQFPLGITLAAFLCHPRLRFATWYRSAIFVPAILSFVVVGFIWKMILSPLWGIAPGMLSAVGLGSLYAPWLGKEEHALTTLALVSVWQFVGIPMMLVSAALVRIPQEVLEAGALDGLTGLAAFWHVKLPLIMPTIGIITILTFVGSFSAFDLVFAAQGALAGPAYSTDVLGTFLYRTFFGYQQQIGDAHMGAAVATAMFTVILLGVGAYLWGRGHLRHHQL